MKNIYLTLFGFFLFIHVVWCQSSIAYLGINQGLSNDLVTTIFQDRDGFIWFGTSNGLNRYDGYEFKVFKNDPLSKNTLSDNRITAITESKFANLYVATKSGLVVIDPSRTNYQQVLLQLPDGNTPINFAVHQVEQDGRGQVFAQGGAKGLLKIQETKDYNIAQLIPLKYDGQSLSNYRVNTICKAAGVGIWAIIENLGLAYYDSEKDTFSLTEKGNFQSAAMVADPTGNIWFSNRGQIVCYNTNARSFTYYNFGPYRKPIVNLYYGKDKKLWICTDGMGIQKLDINTGKFGDQVGFDQQQLTSKSIFAVLEDKDNRIWIGTLRGGINIIDPLRRRFKTSKINPNSRLVNTSDFTLSFEEADQNHIWIGTDGDGLYKWNKTRGVIENYPFSSNLDLRHTFVTALVQDRLDQLWIGTYDMGILKLNTRTGVTKHYTCYFPNTKYINNTVWRLFKDRKGVLWASTLSGGNVYFLDKVTDQFKPLDLPINDVLTFYEDKNNVLWMGSWNFLFKLDLRTMEYKNYRIGTPIRFIQQTENGFLWLGTEGAGLLHLNLSTMNYRRYTEKDGLVSNTLLNALQDTHGNIWISSLDGLSKMDVRKKAFQNFYQSDGLQSNQFNYNAAIKLRDGQLIFGGIRGFNIFNPLEIFFQTKYPPLKFTELSIDNIPFGRAENQKGVSLNTVKSLKIPYDSATLSFSFAALDFTFSDRINYAYYLEGWDKDWNYVNKQRAAYYSNLKEGRYTLRIKSTNANGEWNQDERTISIQILPPWYRNTWAYLGYMSLLIGAIYLYNKYRENKALLLVKLKTAEFEREKEHELTEEKLTFFTHIVHEIRTPLTLIVNPIKDIISNTKKNKEELDELKSIYTHSKRLLNLADKLLLFRKTDGNFDELSYTVFDVVYLFREVFESFRQLANYRNITYLFESAIERQIIKADYQKLEICFVNLLQNALKYTAEGGSISVKIDSPDQELRFDIIDSGQGLPTQLTDEIFKPFKRNFRLFNKSEEGFGIGLFFVKKFIALHQGKLEYSANANAGVTFSITLPLDDLMHVDMSYKQLDTQKTTVEYAPTVQENDLGEVLGPLSIKKRQVDELYSTILRDKILVVDDNEDMLRYISNIFSDKYHVINADSAESAMSVLEKLEPSIVISDVMMAGDSGIDLCKQIKNSTRLSHIPIILLTASSSFDVKLKGIEVGADDYVNKPFDKELLLTRVESLIENKNRLHAYFYSEITLKSNDYKVPVAFKDFLQQAIEIVEMHLLDEAFTVKTLAEALGMSHSNMYRRIKSISGKSANEFIRYIRMRRAAQLLIANKTNINETAYSVGFKDIKHFRQHFAKIFGCSPSEYRKRYNHLGKAGQ
ncbi:MULTISPECIES: hybrid sensor histidine kinase/response regulator transcription factor [Sphingobacterium]|uniref:hybrid sensor histidine kinase/response regulator transcription factor n=1 Tax=Sphingobacterium TaxID=28453 RepID=UPI00257FBE1A|nr:MULTISPECIES: hybrid sensor histidine kinase/response regulator transcription factor [Sphingobacterium]